MLLTLVVASSLTAVLGRYCVDDQKGWCRGHDIWGWCFHNKTDGRFDCDSAAFCAGQEQLKNKKSTGCFLRGNNTVCCCNEADGCNLGFISIQPKYAVGQQCVNTIEEPNEDLKIFKACEDPWCFAYLTAEVEVGLTSVQRGCRSRKTLVHHISKDQHTKYKNNTNWIDTERLVNLPTCADITWGAEWINGTQSMCLDFNYEEDEVEKKGRLCCCRGGHKCNERFMWGDEGITQEELKEILRKRDTVADSSSTISAITAVLLGFLFYGVIVKFL
ncbi:hypothetical protein ANCCAN_08830 [Ancylostoma caninum]|uniref:Uncharacterized protein n=1 Tax=Ancylostoma caninum TaxID=29170 RepID=A0A368GL90_ANCCA|nr:hypothetical protein ANCCAN_08830 [Ancylostoma caninum]